jgi:hypothetical protein
MLDEKVQCQTKQIHEYQNSIEVISDLYENINFDQNDTKSKLDHLQGLMKKIEVTMNEIKENQQDQHETILDLQCRSMQDNLIFYGIEEPKTETGEYENTEESLNEFITNKMKIHKSIQFQRVHRLGKRRRDQIKPRPIIAKFKEDKDRELIKYTAPEVLKGSEFGVREQYPREIENRRKVLYPKLKEAKETGQRARLVRDRLYIDNERFVPDYNEFPKIDKRSNREYDNGKPHQTRDTQDIKRTKVYYRTNTNRTNTNRNTASPTGVKTPTTNRFQVLIDMEDEHEPSHSSKGKRAAKSPIDTYLETKKYRECSPITISSEEDMESHYTRNPTIEPEQQDNTL